jgi:hypothetical protein
MSETAAAFTYDPYTAAFQARAHEIYRELRDQHPVYHNPERGIWAISRFEDVWQATLDLDVLTTEGIEEATLLLPMLNFLDPPRHDRLRALVSRAFTHRRVQEMEPRIRALARELLDEIDPREDCDLLAGFAEPLPGRVIAEMIGVPPERRATFLSHTRAMLNTDPTKSISETIRDPSERIYAEFGQLLEERRRERRDDLMSALVDAEIDGEQLGDDEILGFCYQLIVAGNDTTTALIGNGVVLLAQHADQRAQLAKEPSTIPNAVEEVLRYEAPAQALPRRSLKVSAYCSYGRPPTSTSASSTSRNASTSHARSAGTWASGTASTSAWAPLSRDSKRASPSKSCSGATPTTLSSKTPAGSHRAGLEPTPCFRCDWAPREPERLDATRASRARPHAPNVQHLNAPVQHFQAGTNPPHRTRYFLRSPQTPSLRRWSLTFERGRSGLE